MAQEKKQSNHGLNLVGMLAIFTIAALLLFVVRFFVNFEDGVMKTGLSEALANALNRNGQFSSDLGTDSDSETRVCYRVTANSNGTVLLKAFAYGDMENNAWQNPVEYQELINNSISCDYLTALYCDEQGALIYSMKIDPNYNNYVLPYYTSPMGSSVKLQTSDIENSGDVSSPYTAIYFGANKYNADTLSSMVKSSPRTQYSQEELAYRTFVYEHYTAVPQTTKQYFLDILRDKGWSKDTKNIYSNISNYVSNAASYDLEFDRAMNNESDVVVAFMSKYKKGICQHFASAAVLMYRSAGIPARRVDGFSVKAIKDEEVEVTNRDAHAWVEIYVDGVGWVPTDPTGRTVSNEDNQSVIKPKISQVPQDGVDGRYYPLGADEDGVIHDSRKEGDFLEGDLIDLIKKYDGFYYTAGFYGNADKSGSIIDFEYPSGFTKLGNAGLTNIEEFHIYNADGDEVTNDFDFSYEQGLFVQVRTILYLTTEDVSREYNGQPLTGAGTEVYYTGNLEPNHTIVSYNFISSRTEVGKTPNYVEPVIVDENGEDVSDEYGYDYTYLGTLHVYKYLLRIRGKNANFTFNNTDRTVEAYSIEAGHLAETDELRLTFQNTFRDIGVHENPFKVEILRGGVDATDDYEIEAIPGEVKITPVLITVTAGSERAAYTPGASLQCDEDDFTYEYQGYIEDLVVKVTMPTILTEQGIADNDIEEVKIYYSKKDQNDNTVLVDITKNFIITTISGELELY